MHSRYIMPTPLYQSLLCSTHITATRCCVMGYHFMLSCTVQLRWIRWIRIVQFFVHSTHTTPTGYTKGKIQLETSVIRSAVHFDNLLPLLINNYHALRSLCTLKYLMKTVGFEYEAPTSIIIENSSVRKIYILRPIRDQLRKMQLQSLGLGIEPATLDL